RSEVLYYRGTEAAALATENCAFPADDGVTAGEVERSRGRVSDDQERRDTGRADHIAGGIPVAVSTSWPADNREPQGLVPVVEVHDLHPERAICVDLGQVERVEGVGKRVGDNDVEG